MAGGEVELSKYCGSCGAAAEAGDAFCSQCGNMFSIAPVTAVRDPMATAVVPAQPPRQAPSWNSPAQYGPPPQAPGRFLDPVTGAPLASWGKRLAARLLDGLILGVPTTVISIVVFVIVASSIHTTTTYDTASNNRALAIALIAWFGVPVVFNLLAITYYICFIGGKKGQTFGMRIVKVRVRDASNSQQPIGFGRSFMRMMVQVSFAILVIPVILDNLAPLWSPRRQCWHDNAVGSIVEEIV